MPGHLARRLDHERVRRPLQRNEPGVHVPEGLLGEPGADVTEIQQLPVAWS
jgi:hypothetical protein